MTFIMLMLITYVTVVLQTDSCTDTLCPGRLKSTTLL